MIFHPHHRNTGFTLIETIVGTAVFVVVALSAYKAFGVLMDAVSSARAKIAATSVANEKFEIIRNLPYDDVGIVNGIPDGKLAHTETVTRDNYSFNLTTTVRNQDDSFDGTIGGSPSDTSPADYKLAELDIACGNCKIFFSIEVHHPGGAARPRNGLH
ncbi:MAG: prepilin-type N-terminal cleavage/methylation domain-containing protein [bacterium]